MNRTSNRTHWCLCWLATLWLCGGIALAASTPASGSGAAPTPAPCPSGYELSPKDGGVCCPIGFECYRKLTVAVFTLQEAASVDRAMIALERDLIIAQARGRRWGCVAGGGLGVSVVATVGFETEVAPAGHVGVTCGLRF